MHLAHPRASDCAQFGYTVVMGVSNSSCGSSEAIAQVGVPNIAVLATLRDARTSTTGSIFRTRSPLLEHVAYGVEHPIFIATAFIVIPVLSMPMTLSCKFCGVLGI